MLRIAQALDEADAFGLSRMEEAVWIAPGGFEAAAYSAGRIFGSDELEAASHYQVELAVNDWEQLLLLEKVNCNSKSPCWLKVDTGMHRLVSTWQRQPQHDLEQLHLSASARLMTHLHADDLLQDSATDCQMQLFRR